MSKDKMEDVGYLVENLGGNAAKIHEATRILREVGSAMCYPDLADSLSYIECAIRTGVNP